MSVFLVVVLVVVDFVAGFVSAFAFGSAFLAVVDLVADFASVLAVGLDSALAVSVLAVAGFSSAFFVVASLAGFAVVAFVSAGFVSTLAVEEKTKAVVFGSDSIFNGLTYVASSNNNIVKVNADNTIEGVATGSADVKVAYQMGGEVFTKTITVTVA